jgi:hypothetical protein
MNTPLLEIMLCLKAVDVMVETWPLIKSLSVLCYLSTIFVVNLLITNETAVPTLLVMSKPHSKQFQNAYGDSYYNTFQNPKL